MFGWFSPKCPLATWEKTWTESRMRWLAEKLGIERLLKADVILPTDDFFPDPYDATPAAARRLMERVAGYVGIDPRMIEFEVCADVQLPGAVGLYEGSGRTVIRIATSQLAEPQRLVATLAHELAHEMLLGRGLLTTDVEDHEWVTDLLPVFLGIGIFAANATLSEASGQDGLWSWWTMHKEGYLPSRIFGYAFALFALMRGEEHPPWVSYLRLDASGAVREGLRFLRKTGDSLFHPDTIRGLGRRPSATELIDRLQTGTASFRLAALWEIRENGEADPEMIAAIMHCLEDRDPAIPGEAARTLAALGPAASAATPQLLKAVHAFSPSTRAGAAQALGEIGGQAGAVVPELCALLDDPNHDVVAEAAVAFWQFGPEAESATDALLAALRTAIIDCDHVRIEPLAGALLAVARQPKRRVREYFNEHDPELRQLALEALKEQRARSVQEEQADDPAPDEPPSQ